MNIQVRRLAKTYVLDRHEVPVLRAIDMTLSTGDLVALTGPSGVGKSTLLHVLGTLDSPTSGSLTMDGVDVSSLSPAALAAFRNRHIGFVFQFHHLLPEFSALENVMMPALISRTAPRIAAERAEKLLDEVGLSDRMHHRPGELSGGEQQRVALARALVNEPRLLLADEPTGNLDEQTGAGIHEVIAGLNRRRGITALVVTHNPRLAQRMPRCLQLTRAGLSEGAYGGEEGVPPGTPA